MQPVRINQRVALPLDHLDVFHSDAAQFASHEFSRALDIGLVFRSGADARNPQQVLEFAKEALLIFASVGYGWRGHGWSFLTGLGRETFKYSGKGNPGC